MSDDGESITLAPRTYDKLGIVHCGVIREGRISCGGKVADIDDGATVEFKHVRVTVTRKGEEYTFTRDASKVA